MSLLLLFHDTEMAQIASVEILLRRRKGFVLNTQSMIWMLMSRWRMVSTSMTTNADQYPWHHIASINQNELIRLRYNIEASFLFTWPLPRYDWKSQSVLRHKSQKPNTGDNNDNMVDKNVIITWCVLWAERPCARPTNDISKFNAIL